MLCIPTQKKKGKCFIFNYQAKNSYISPPKKTVINSIHLFDLQSTQIASQFDYDIYFFSHGGKIKHQTLVIHFYIQKLH